MPVSLTVTLTKPRLAEVGLPKFWPPAPASVSGTVVVGSTLKVILPLPCMASRALVAMLISAVSNWPASARTRQGSVGRRMAISMAGPSRGASMSRSDCIRSPTSNTSGFRV